MTTIKYTQKKITLLIKETFWGFVIPVFFFVSIFVSDKDVNLIVAEAMYLATIYGIYNYKEDIDGVKISGVVYLGVFFHCVLLITYIIAYK